MKCDTKCFTDDESKQQLRFLSDLFEKTNEQTEYFIEDRAD